MHDSCGQRAQFAAAYSRTFDGKLFECRDVTNEITRIYREDLEKNLYRG
jgi:hypothetical protein